MSENYRIIGQARGEPRSLGDVGVRLRFQLSGRPSRRWSQDLCARLTTELIGHPGVAHLRVDVRELVQADEIVLDGVEDRDAPTLVDALQRAVDATNHIEIDQAGHRPNVTQTAADAVASHMRLNEPDASAATGAGADPPCPRCGQGVPITVGDRETGDQLALGELECPNCGARLVRDVQGPADRGWRPAD
jgi:ribosomal protein S27AE